jgi:hypothetical protein
MAELSVAPQWLYEDGIGEARAALVSHGTILEAVIERSDDRARAGAVLHGRLTQTIIPRRRGVAVLDGGEEVLIEPIPPKIAEGAAVLVEITREAIAEPGLDGVRAKRALGRIAAPGVRPTPGTSLLKRLGGGDVPMRLCLAHEFDWLEQSGWSALCDEAMSGEVVREDAALRIFPTPAMTLIDIDGVAPPAQLGPKGAKLAAQAIRRIGLTGSIGIDLPTMNNRDERLIAAAQIDKYLPLPFERTAVNGFGFVQIIRRRERASVMEVLREDIMRTAALAALRLAERHRGGMGAGMGAVTLTVPAPIAHLIERMPAWTQMLEKRRGGALTLIADSRLGPGACHAA